MYQIIQHRKIWLSLSALMVGAAVVLLAMYGLNFGIDFTGGSLLEVKFLSERPAISEVQEKLADLKLSSLTIQPVEEKGMILRFQETDEETHQQILSRLRELTNNFVQDTEQPTASSTWISAGQNNGVEELRFDSVGPSIGQELKRKSLMTIFLVLVFIVGYIAWAFRQVSKPVASWKYGLAAIVALFHDVIITLGVFAVLGRFWDMEINTPFVAAILMVLGYSVNDTIVVFDRLRENLPRSNADFEEIVNKSVNDTIGRSVNTSFTTLLVLLSILFLGGDTIRSFVLALAIGVFVGTYSSIFLASPLLVIWEKLKK